MITLLDVNVVIALLDAFHPLHATAHQWFFSPTRGPWATCPIVENGVVRIVGNSKYPSTPGSPAEVIEYLDILRSEAGYLFLADDISLLNGDFVRQHKLTNAKFVTDVYLLALAASHGGKFATFDRKIPVEAVRGGKDALLVLGEVN